MSRFIKIYDVSQPLETVVLGMVRIHDEMLIGRLKCRMFELVDGHLYYQDNVIKIHYDVLQRKQTSRTLEQSEVFSEYRHMLCLDAERGDKATTRMPRADHYRHRLLYLVKDEHLKRPVRVLSLPFLHERRIHLWAGNAQKRYFSTMVPPDDTSVSTNHLIAMINLTNSYYVLFTTSGVNLGERDYSGLVRRYGDPKAVSNNGQIYVFRRVIDHEVRFNVMKLDTTRPEGFAWLREVDIKSSIREYIVSDLGDYGNGVEIIRLRN